MSGCDWQKKSFSVSMNEKSIDKCEDCGGDIKSYITRIGGKKLCSECASKVIKGKAKESLAPVNINTYNWVTDGAYEHIDPHNPNMKFENKEQLMKACEERGLLAKAFMKPKSQGHGWEHSKR